MPRPKGSKNRPKVSPLVEEKFEKALDKAAKESGIKPKGIVELAKEFVPSKMEAIAPVVEDLMLVQEKLEQLKKKPTEVRGKRIDVDTLPDGVEILGGSETRAPGYAIDMDKVPDRDIDKFVAKLPQLPKTPVSLPEGWEKLGKIERLQWLTQHKKR